MTYLDQKFNDFEVGVNYPKPIVNMEEHGNSLVIFYGKWRKTTGKRRVPDITITYYGRYWR
jgi:hypothetical protein